MICYVQYTVKYELYGLESVLHNAQPNCAVVFYGVWVHYGECMWYTL